MKTYPNIDYSQRPANYWNEEEILALLLRNVKGRERRKMIRAYYQEGRLQELDETFLRETLSEQERDQLGKIHPMFMGGEYLPDYLNGEVEIARIELQSTTADVISIRARPKRNRIYYRIVDEYDTPFALRRKSSQRPLTLRELVRLIDDTEHPDIGVGLGLCYNEMNAEGLGERESLRHFSRVSSDFYPQLGEHYENVYEDWVEEGLQEGQENSLEPEEEGAPNEE